MKCKLCNQESFHLLCSNCSQFTIKIPGDSNSIDIIVGEFISLHTEEWGKVSTPQQYFGTKFGCIEGEYYLRIASSEENLQAFFTAFPHQFSIFIQPEVKNNMAIPLWRDNTTMQEWIEGGYLFADYARQINNSLWQAVHNFDVLMTIASKSLMYFWNFLFRNLRKHAINLRYNWKNAKLHETIAELLQNHTITLEEAKKYQEAIQQDEDD